VVVSVGDPMAVSTRMLLGLVTALLFAAPVSALSVYDVILLSRQDFSDEQLITLIDATESAFQLTAEDVTRLSDLGVSEAVIQKMLSVTVVSGDADGTDPESSSPTVAPPTPSRFSIGRQSEPGAGAHDHVQILIDGMPLLVLRDEGGSATVLERGRRVIENLEHAAEERGRFTSLAQGGRAAVVYESEDGTAHPVISVTGTDAVAYQRRSRRVDLDAAVLAAYWSGLLDDIWSIAFWNEEPQRLAGLHDSDALRLLYDLTVANGEDLGRTVERMPSEVQHHLEELVNTVPDDFEIASETP
jgi:hypothetical protein